MDSFTHENWLVFTKSDKTERFTENRPVEFEIFKKLRNFGIKILKKMAIILRILVKIKFKSSSYFILEN
jgi:hypothetical protein